MKLSRGRIAGLAATLWLILPTVAATALANEEPVASATGVESTLKKLEGQAALSKAGETAVIDEMLARVKRMTATVAELHTLIEAIPAQRCPTVPEPQACPPASTGSPTSSPPSPKAPAVTPRPKPAVPAPEAKPNVADDFLTDLPWQAIAATLVVVALLGMLWRQRRRQQDDAADAFPVTQPSVPPSPTTNARKVSPGPTPPAATVAPAEAALSPSVAAVEPAPGAPSTVAAETGGEPGTADADLSLELAEVMLSMGLTDGAAQTLTDHIRAHPRQALFHWLKLLDIYRKSGMKNDFEKSAQEIQQHFNMAPPDWEPTDPDAKPPNLESYAHVISRVQELWPRRSCAEYLSRLLEDNRGGTRTGFPQTVVEEILLLVALLKDLGR